MTKTVRLASFCRLCLTKTKDKVPVFAEGSLLDDLLKLIEIKINPDDESNAVVCYDCVVTLEGFHQFKEQCHVNDEFVKTIPPKADDEALSAEEEDDQDDRSAVDDDDEQDIEEEDHLELSEEEEVFHELPASRKSPRSKKKPAPKKSPVGKSGKTKTKTKSPKKAKDEDNKPGKQSLDEMQVIQESYPDFFYFEKGSRSVYYTMVYYGERYNSALFSERSTYWQCTNRRRYSCPARVKVTNDYKHFERHFEHTHEQLPEKNGQAFTPHEALPEIFKICKRIVESKKINYDLKLEETIKSETVDNDDEEDSDEETFESTFQKFANSKKKSAKIYSSESDDSTDDARSKKKTKPKTNAQQKKRRAISESETEIKSKKTKKVEQLSEDSDEDDNLDLDQIEQECDALNVPKRPSCGPTLDEMLVLGDSYPDYFFFEKGPRSIYFTLVYYGERFHSALFTERYTYWQCRHRRKYKCPAQVAVTNDYKSFERRYEHTHPALPDKEGQAFTPTEALPELFAACRKIVRKNKAKRRQKLLHKYQFLNSINSSAEKPSTDSVDLDQEEMVEVIDVVEEDTTSMKDDLEYEELIEED
ncbi:uncharacterized protein LOC134223643 [Armigeres subalbatus]|uniref:uncharacterized protein LOC134223643 n=1 Tax=Armigeres subalbatus TaxID=124917 RepID=UPI002ED6546E